MTSLRVVVACESDGCDLEATCEFTESGRVVARRCSDHAKRIFTICETTARIRDTGVPDEVALEWATTHAMRNS